MGSSPRRVCFCYILCFIGVNFFVLQMRIEIFRVRMFFCSSIQIARVVEFLFVLVTNQSVTVLSDVECLLMYHCYDCDKRRFLMLL